LKLARNVFWGRRERSKSQILKIYRKSFNCSTTEAEEKRFFVNKAAIKGKKEMNELETSLARIVPLGLLFHDLVKQRLLANKKTVKCRTFLQLMNWCNLVKAARLHFLLRLNATIASKGLQNQFDNLTAAAVVSRDCGARRKSMPISTHSEKANFSFAYEREKTAK